MTTDPQAERLAKVKATLKCAHCETDLEKMNPPESPFPGWETPHLFVCFNDDCPYHVRSNKVLEDQGIIGGSYRFVYDPFREWCGPLGARALGNPSPR